MSADPNADPDVGADPDSDTEMSTDIDPDVDISTANTMRERANESRIKLAVLLSANRLLITALLAVLVFIALVVVGTLVYPSIETSIQHEDPIDTLFSTMVSAIITGVTLVLTISQLVLSQENGPLGDQHNRMSDTMNVRTYIQELIGQPAPADPSAFLRTLVNAAERRASALRETVANNDDDQLRAEVNEFTQSVMGNATEVRNELDGATFGEFDVLVSAMNFNYSWKVFQTERIASDHSDSLTDEDNALLEELKTTLSMFGPAREHIKTLYFEWALIDLSQLILYAAVPALITAAAMLLFVQGSSLPGATFGVPDLLWVISAAFTITTLPFLLLISYIARIATLAKRTLAIGPLILRESQR